MQQRNHLNQFHHLSIPFHTTHRINSLRIPSNSTTRFNILIPKFSGVGKNIQVTSSNSKFPSIFNEFLRSNFLFHPSRVESNFRVNKRSRNNVNSSLSLTEKDFEKFSFMESANQESILLICIILWMSSNLILTSFSTFYFETIALLFLTFTSLWIEKSNILKLDIFQPRPGASSGLSIGLLTLPLLFSSKMIQEYRSSIPISLNSSPFFSSSSSSHFYFLTSCVCASGVVFSLYFNSLFLSKSKQDKLKSNDDVEEKEEEEGKENEKEKESKNENEKKENARLPSTFSSKKKEKKMKTFFCFCFGWIFGNFFSIFLLFTFRKWTAYDESFLIVFWLFLNSIFCLWMICFVFQKFPRTSTLGETILVVEGISFYLMNGFGKTIKKIFPSLSPPSFFFHYSTKGTGSEIDSIIQAMIFGLFLFPFLWQILEHFLKKLQNWTTFKSKFLFWTNPKQIRIFSCYLSLLCVIFLFVPYWLKQVIGFQIHPIFWVLNHILEHAQTRVFLCFYWLAVMLLPLGKLRQLAVDKTMPHIIVRKYYHIMSVIMFTPALIFQAGFLRLSFGAALSAFLILEILRMESIPPFGKSIDDFFRAFIDSRDSGRLIISHFSLLLGCCIPVWLSCNTSSSDRLLPPFAGILSLGIGDTMASMVGFHRGRRKISSDSKKTIEGTMAGILSTLLCCFLLSLLPLSPLPMSISTSTTTCIVWLKIIMATISSGLLEAFTSQLDNVFVPLIYFSLLTL